MLAPGLLLRHGVLARYQVTVGTFKGTLLDHVPHRFTKPVDEPQGGLALEYRFLSIYPDSIFSDRIRYSLYDGID